MPLFTDAARQFSARWTGFPAETPDSTVWTPVLK